MLKRFIQSSLFVRYTLALAISIAAVCTQKLLGQVSEVASYLLLTPAVLLTAIVAGFGPALLCATLCSGGSYYFFLAPKHAFGLPTFAELIGLAIYFVNSVIISWLISRSQKIRDTSQSNERLFRETIDLAPVGIAHVSLDGHWLRVNRAACSILGYSETELRTKTFGEITYSEDVKEDLKRVTELLRGETKSYTMEKRYVRKDGSLTWAILMVSLVRDEHNDPKYFISCMEDLTDRKQLEEKLHGGYLVSARLAAIVESSNDAIISADLNGRIESWNPGATRMYGYQPEEVIGKHISIIVPQEFMHHEEEIFEQVGAGHYIRHYVTERIGKNRDRIEVSLSVTPVKDQTGQIIGVSKTARDISHMRRIERSLQEALRTRDEFISIASHELKTPITALKLQSEFLTRKLERGGPNAISQSDVKRLTATVESQTERLARLVEDILDLSRIRTGKLSIQKENLRLDELVREVIDSLQVALDGAGTPIILERLEAVEGYFDRLRIEQVLTNLLTNAMRYGERKAVYLRLERIAGAPERIKLSVRDQGKGVAPEAHQKIFDRFERAGETKSSGLGLGLFITQQIVQAHEGRIWVESAGSGQGSTFIVELPHGESIKAASAG